MLDVRELRTYFLTDLGNVRAVDGISFTMNEGERLGVVGESGSGKSVTAASIMRLIEPPGATVGGEVLFRGRDLLKIREREMQKIRGREIAIIFQDPMTALDPVFTIGSQMTETLRIHRNMNKKEAETVAIDTLADVHIPNPEKRIRDYQHQFSGGMRQRVVIAMALLCDPTLLIADEPTTALDVTSQAQVMDLMLGLANDRGTAVMLITHDLGVVAGFCENVQVMYAGEIIERGPAGPLYANPEHPYTRGLLESVPRLDDEGQDQLFSIRGSAPSMTTPPDGCRFWPRCDSATDLCVSERPEPCAGFDERECACHFAGRLGTQREGADV
ncbi:oligopeptide transport ATP-binding protein OppD [bacterium BMS3Bbin02]|nr:oligopeptide transport ATP-binding protein OppD [bacterium BMS3Bbin02]